MKIESCGKKDYSIFINDAYFENNIYTEKELLISFIKKFILKIKNKLNLCGFYKIKVYPQEHIGIFLDVNKLDDIEFTNALDLRVIVLSDVCIYFETDDYDLIRNCNDKRYMDGHFYCIVDNCFDGLLEKVEFGKFIYGTQVVELLNRSLIL